MVIGRLEVPVGEAEGVVGKSATINPMLVTPDYRAKSSEA